MLSVFSFVWIRERHYVCNLIITVHHLNREVFIVLSGVTASTTLSQGRAVSCLQRSDRRWWPSDPVFTVCYVIEHIENVKENADLSGRAHKCKVELTVDCSQGLFEWWRKNLAQLQNQCKVTFSHKVHQNHTIHCPLNERRFYNRGLKSLKTKVTRVLPLICYLP